MTPVALAGTVLAVLLVVPLACAGIRMVRGPGLADRLVAFDMLTGVAVGFSAATAIATGEAAFLDVGLGLALVAFVASCALARFLERQAGGRQTRGRQTRGGGLRGRPTRATR